MNRFILSASILALSTGMAMAQNAAPATGAATPPRPVTATPATPSPAIPVVAVKGSAATAAEARTAYTASVNARQAACTARGATFIWTPAHAVGDANPKGGFYAKPSNGSCRQMTLKQATEKGLVTVR